LRKSGARKHRTAEEGESGSIDSDKKPKARTISSAKTLDKLIAPGSPKSIGRNLGHSKKQFNALWNDTSDGTRTDPILRVLSGPVNRLWFSLAHPFGSKTRKGTLSQQQHFNRRDHGKGQ
jgi:hypothetical protein